LGAITINPNESDVFRTFLIEQVFSLMVCELKDEAKWIFAFFRGSLKNE